MSFQMPQVFISSTSEFAAERKQLAAALSASQFAPFIYEEEAASGKAQIAFLLKATAIEDVARISFGGGVMPQKSTDFYPKLLSGLTIYTLDDSSVLTPVPS